MADFGLFHMTGYGSFTNFPIGYVVLMNRIPNLAVTQIIYPRKPLQLLEQLRHGLSV